MLMLRLLHLCCSYLHKKTSIKFINTCNKSNLYQEFIKNRNEVNEQRYKKYKNKLISVLQRSKQEYYTKFINEH